MNNFTVLVLGSNGLVGSSAARVLENSPKVKKVFKAPEKTQTYFH